MKIVKNESSYDTRAVRRVLQAVARTFQRRECPIRFWPGLRVQLLEGRGDRIRVDEPVGVDDGKLQTGTRLDIYLPRLRGTEFIGLLRQQHGGQSNVDHGGLTAEGLALQIQATLFALVTQQRPRQWQWRALMDRDRTLRGIPKRIPLRIIKPSPPRDRVRERYARVLQLEKVWRTRAKLADTKLKKLRGRRRYYEKMLAARTEGSA